MMIATELRGSTTTGASKVDAPETETVQVTLLQIWLRCLASNVDAVKSKHCLK